MARNKTHLIRQLQRTLYRKAKQVPLCMPCDEGCRTAVLGKTERTVGREGNGELTMMWPVRHCDGETRSQRIGPIYRSRSHSFTLDIPLSDHREARWRRHRVSNPRQVVFWKNFLL